MKLRAALLCLPLITGAQASAQALPDAFRPGPVIEEFGPSAPVETATPLPEEFELKVAFDIASTEERRGVNRQFETVARFLNMHARAGVPRENIQPAIVVHGAAAAYLVQPGPEEDPSDTVRLVMQLIEQDVPVYLCGQTAAAQGIGADELLPGVTLSLSAMTAHAELARGGYSLNPF